VIEALSRARARARVYRSRFLELGIYHDRSVYTEPHQRVSASAVAGVHVCVPTMKLPALSVDVYCSWRIMAGRRVNKRARAVFARAAIRNLCNARAEKRRRDNNARINPILFVARDDRAVVVLRADAIKTRPRTAQAASSRPMIYNRRIYEAADHSRRFLMASRRSGSYLTIIGRGSRGSD